MLSYTFLILHASSVWVDAEVPDLEESGRSMAARGHAPGLSMLQTFYVCNFGIGVEAPGLDWLLTILSPFKATDVEAIYTCTPKATSPPSASRWRG